MELPTLSIGIMCKDEERTIEKCLNVIFEQINIQDEVIVVDTGSTDQTIEIIEREFPQLRLYRKEWNDNFSEIRNYIISLSNKQWVFFVDSDEILQNEAINNVKKSIVKINSTPVDKVVLCPKVVNSNDSVVFNTGRIIRNNGKYSFFGDIHEYPVYENNLSANDIVTIILQDVVIFHDGYESDVMQEKEKSQRNTKLNRKMLEKFPESDRYYFFYCRDAKPLLNSNDYIISLKNFIDIFPNSPFRAEVFLDLIRELIILEKLEEVDFYIEEYWEEAHNSETFSKSTLIYLSVINEIQKISKKQIELLEIMINTESQLESDMYRDTENGYKFQDIIGFLYWSIGNFQQAMEIQDSLKSEGYVGMFTELLSKLSSYNGRENEI
ncbi:glycosyltransferase [Enterococcus casseliflavus]|nr:glycosyltransferase [Enterococcus casseliflavus]MBO1144182.1 glycosyltransferase [Enterococcus casseliflavus]